ncbi:hypothetical protein LIER_33798 [Lithospermum erythrorhizon]|uniref:DUF4283 domain-containing protein n=1 Tax=Lithospermum erythrorhizon TaxID=34254 RepID=A0AAV3S0Y4_LITER
MDAEIICNLWNCSLTERMCQFNWKRRIYHMVLLDVFFAMEKKKDRVTRAGPWCFDNKLIVIENWRRGLDHMTCDFDTYFFYIHVQGLKEEYFTREVVGMVGLLCLVHPRVVWSLASLVTSKKSRLVFLIETKLWNNECDDIKYKLKMPNPLIIESERRKGGLAFLWGRDIGVEVISYSTHHIEAIIVEGDSEP